jgi:hypothetical protein
MFISNMDSYAPPTSYAPSTSYAPPTWFSQCLETLISVLCCTEPSH